MEKVFIAVVAVVGFIVLYSVLTAVPLMLLWNALLPDLFGFKQIDFWQALGLAVLSNILFKSTNSSSSKS